MEKTREILYHLQNILNIYDSPKEKRNIAIPFEFKGHSYILQAKIVPKIIGKIDTIALKVTNQYNEEVMSVTSELYGRNIQQEVIAIDEFTEYVESITRYVYNIIKHIHRVAELINYHNTISFGCEHVTKNVYTLQGIDNMRFKSLVNDVVLADVKHVNMRDFEYYLRLHFTFDSDIFKDTDDVDQINTFFSLVQYEELDYILWLYQHRLLTKISEEKNGK